MADVLADHHDLLLLDLDGVVYVGEHAVPGAVEALARAHREGRATGYATNNASRTPEEVAEHLQRLGIPARTQDVTTSSQAAAQLVRERLGEGARVLPVGGPGVRAALLVAGLVPVAPDGEPQAVVQGFGRQVGWSDLADAAAAIRGGALWVATNTDLTLPTERGPAPGNGSLVGAVRNAVDVDPLVAGKPQPTLFRAAARRVGASAPLAIGDRLDTDVAGAVLSGVTGALVLTGLHGPLHALAAAPDQRPDLLLGDLSALHAAPPSTAQLGDGEAVCGRARAVVDGGVLRPAPGAPGPGHRWRSSSTSCGRRAPSPGPVRVRSRSRTRPWPRPCTTSGSAAAASERRRSRMVAGSVTSALVERGAHPTGVL